MLRHAYMHTLPSDDCVILLFYVNKAGFEGFIDNFQTICIKLLDELRCFHA